MKKNKKLKLSESQFQEQVIEPKVEKAEISEEEEEEKKGIIAWFKKHKKGITLTGIGIGLVMIISLSQCSWFQQEEPITEDPTNRPGYEDMDDNTSKVPDNTVKPLPTNPEIVAKECECSDEDCLCDDDELGCLCKDGEHEEDCIANVAVKPIGEEDTTGGKKPTDGEEVKPGGTTTEPGQTTPTGPTDPNEGTEIGETPVKEEHTHEFGEWQSVNDYYEQRTCACGETETRTHTYTDSISYDYAYGDKHHTKTTSTCDTCGHVKEVTVLESCDYTITSYNATYEYVTCDDCGHKTTKKHVLDKGTVQKDGSTLYTCTHDGCEYTKKVQPVKDNDNDDTKDNTGTRPGGTDPSNPGGTDPSNPGGTDPSNPGGTDPSNPGKDPSDPGSNPGGDDDNKGDDDDNKGDEDNRGDYENGSEKEPDRGGTDQGSDIVIDEDEDEDEKTNDSSSVEQAPSISDSTTSTQEPSESAPSTQEPAQTESTTSTQEPAQSEEAERTVESVGVDQESQRGSEDRGQTIELDEDEEETFSMASIQTELQTLYTMREIVVGEMTFEYPETTTQYVLKK